MMKNPMFENGILRRIFSPSFYDDKTRESFVVGTVLRP
ncbi:hypothetical protein DOT_3268 [Desulfosporosinus sp. OT]|nr:hypothetical protein DOT_3268 [Desulfosporosinus sp. OT]